MAGTSGKHLLCFVHIGGRFITNGEGFVTYFGGTTRLKISKKAQVLKSLRRSYVQWWGNK